MTCQNIVLGDVNGDGVVNVLDVTLVQKYIVGVVDFNCAQKLRARVNWNAFPITVKESTTIQKYIVGCTDVYFYAVESLKMKAILQHLWITGRFVLSGN